MKEASRWGCSVQAAPRPVGALGSPLWAAREWQGHFPDAGCCTVRMQENVFLAENAPNVWEHWTPWWQLLSEASGGKTFFAPFLQLSCKLKTLQKEKELWHQVSKVSE